MQVILPLLQLAITVFFLWAVITVVKHLRKIEALLREIRNRLTPPPVS